GSAGRLALLRQHLPHHPAAPLPRNLSLAHLHLQPHPKLGRLLRFRPAPAPPGPVAGLLMRFAAFLSRRRAAAVLLIAAAAGLATISAGAGESLDHGLRNLRDAARLHPASGEIHIVEIDARSIDTFDRWPWPRSIHGAAIDKLREAGVRSIAFDVDFSRPSDARQDA